MSLSHVVLTLSLSLRFILTTTPPCSMMLAPSSRVTCWISSVSSPTSSSRRTQRLRRLPRRSAISFTLVLASLQMPWASYSCSSSPHARCSPFHAIRFRLFQRFTCLMSRCRATPSAWLSSMASQYLAWFASRMLRWTPRTPP